MMALVLVLVDGSALLVQKALNLSEAQLQDLTCLRRLYITKRSVLHVKRQAAMTSACMGGKGALHPQADFDHFANLAAVLKETAMQDCKAYHQLCHAVFKGVSACTTFTIEKGHVLHVKSACQLHE